MISGSSVQNGRRKRRRGSAFPTSFLALDLIMLVLLAAVSVIGIWLFGGVHLWSIGPMTLVTFTVGILFAFRFFISPYRTDLVIPPGGWVFLALLAYLGILLPFADIGHDARVETYRFVSYAIAFWAWVNVARINQRWRAVMVLLMLSVSVMAWYALIQEVHGSNIVLNRERPAQYGMRASGAYICPNHFANILEMMIPICLAVVLCRDAGLSTRLVAGYTMLVSLAPLYLTESRSGWLGTMAALIVFWLALSLRKGIKKFLLVLIIAPLLAVGLGYAGWSLSPRIQQRVDAAIKGDIRTTLWQDTIEVIKESPIIGSGLGSYRWVFAHSRTHFYLNADPEYAHNDYLHVWSEIGIIGLVLLAALLVMIVIRSVRVLRLSPQSKDIYLMAGLLGAMAGALVHAVFDFNFHIFANTHVFFLLIGILTGITVDQDRYDRIVATVSPRFKWAGFFIVLVLASLIIVHIRDIVSYQYARTGSANVDKMAWDKAESEFKRAMWWSPDNWRPHIGMAHLKRSRSFWLRNPELKAEWIALSRFHYQEALRLNPWDADAYYGLGGLAKLEGDQEAALNYRRLTTEMVPRHTFYLNELGLQLKDMERYDEALEVFLQSRDVARTPVSDRNIDWLRRRIAAMP